MQKQVIETRDNFKILDSSLTKMSGWDQSHYWNSPRKKNSVHSYISQQNMSQLLNKITEALSPQKSPHRKQSMMHFPDQMVVESPEEDKPNRGSQKGRNFSIPLIHEPGRSKPSHHDDPSFELNKSRKPPQNDFSLFRPQKKPSVSTILDTETESLQHSHFDTDFIDDFAMQNKDKSWNTPNINNINTAANPNTANNANTNMMNMSRDSILTALSRTINENYQDIIEEDVVPFNLRSVRSPESQIDENVTFNENNLKHYSSQKRIPSPTKVSSIGNFHDTIKNKLVSLTSQSNSVLFFLFIWLRRFWTK